MTEGAGNKRSHCRKPSWEAITQGGGLSYMLLRVSSCLLS